MAGIKRTDESRPYRAPGNVRRARCDRTGMDRKGGRVAEAGSSSRNGRTAGRLLDLPSPVWSGSFCAWTWFDAEKLQNKKSSSAAIADMV